MEFNRPPYLLISIPVVLRMPVRVLILALT